MCKLWLAATQPLLLLCLLHNSFEQELQDIFQAHDREKQWRAGK